MRSAGRRGMQLQRTPEIFCIRVNERFRPNNSVQDFSRREASRGCDDQNLLQRAPFCNALIVTCFYLLEKISLDAAGNSLSAVGIIAFGSAHPLLLFDLEHHARGRLPAACGFTPEAGFASSFPPVKLYSTVSLPDRSTLKTTRSPMRSHGA
jgi:hypothetical protein